MDAVAQSSAARRVRQGPTPALGRRAAGGGGLQRRAGGRCYHRASHLHGR